MLTRLTHAGIAFAVTAVLYQGYVLAVAPFVEPPGAIAVVAPLTAAELAEPPAALLRYGELLTTYFPAGHWCLDAAPIIVENGHAMLVLDTAKKYTQNDSGELRVPRLALVFFPTARDPSGEPPRDAIILEPAGGATLQMDQQLGQGHGLGSMGRMQFGQLLGEILVRSDMKEPGPADDLRIETRDLYMNEEYIRTPEPVTMQLGGHTGRGRGLEINFMRTEASAGEGPGSLFGKLDTLEITSEVAASILPGATTLFGDEVETAGAMPADARREKLANVPARITCTGPFTIDFSAYSATFSENVVVRQVHDGGKLDELRAAHELRMYFATTQEWGGDVTPTPVEAESAFGSVKLEPATVEAIGAEGAPVTLVAQTQGAEAEGGRVFIDLIQRQATIDGSLQVTLKYRGSEIKAPLVKYKFPPRDSGERLGLMSALGGPGKLRAIPDPARPGEILNVAWLDSMQMVRRGEHTVLVLDNRPRVEMLGRGELWADQMELYLRELVGVAPRPGDANGPLPTTIQAERAVAIGHVGIRSAELNGTVDRLDMQIANPDNAAVGVVGNAAPAPNGADAAFPGGAPAMANTAASPPVRAVRPQSSRAGGLFGPADQRHGPPRTYFVKGRELKLTAVMRDHAAAITTMHITGGVDFQETTPDAKGDAPMRIVAESVSVTDADSPDARIDITGGPATGDLPAGLATIAARGTVLRAPALAVNRGSSRAWINTPGEVQMLMTRDLQGKLLDAPVPLHVTWRDKMELNRDRLSFQGNVFVQHPEGWMRTERLVVVLTEPVRFDGSHGPGAAGEKGPEVAQLECHAGVVAEFDQRDAAGAITSHQHFEVESLVVNQITGEIRGEGQGYMDSVHLSQGSGSWLDLADRSAAGAPTQTVEQEPTGPPELRHLNIQFVRGIDGNIHEPTRVRAFGDVRVVYGPIASWDQRLEMTPGGSPGADTFWLTSDALQVTESPLARLLPPKPDGSRRKFGLVDLQAQGNVVFEGEHPEKGAFVLRGQTATFDQAKYLFILQGDAPPASVTFQQFGGPQQPQTAKAFYYWLKTKDLKIVDPSKMSFDFFDKPK